MPLARCSAVSTFRAPSVRPLRTLPAFGQRRSGGQGKVGKEDAKAIENRSRFRHKWKSVQIASPPFFKHLSTLCAKQSQLIWQTPSQCRDTALAKQGACSLSQDAHIFILQGPWSGLPLQALILRQDLSIRACGSCGGGGLEGEAWSIPELRKTTGLAAGFGGTGSGLEP